MDRHDLNFGPLLKRYGNYISGFTSSAEHLEGRPMEMSVTLEHAGAALMQLENPNQSSSQG